ncbi:MAG: hypothetical protein MUC95_03975 [Spirochaetes bacterium]|nr:hypothetical protein [Spirochaetota bacterium]
MITISLFLFTSYGCCDKYFTSAGSSGRDEGIFAFFTGCGGNVDYSLQKTKYADLEKSIRLAAGYLIDICKADGEFEYCVNMDPDIRMKRSYNMLRHAGAIYALAIYAENYDGGETRRAISHAADFLKDKMERPVSGRSDLLAVGRYSPDGNGENETGIKLGGAGLGLASLCAVERVIPGTTPTGLLKKIGRFIIHMQKKDGSFYSKYYPEQERFDERWTSLYYPGEAALGLLMLYRMDKSPEWLEAAAKAISYLARIRAGSDDVPPDHWALIATAELLPLAGSRPGIISGKALIEHAAQICKSILSANPDHPDYTPEYGSITLDAITCQTATRLEGLLAVLTFLPDEYSELRGRIKSAADRGIAFLVRSQVKEGRYAGGIPRAIRPMSKNHPHYYGDFNLRVGEIRIDYVQHAMCAMMQYERFLLDK